MWYTYKIQWAFYDKKNACKIVDILWARSFDKILFRDENDKIIDRYNWFIMYWSWLADDETKKYIRKMFQKWAKRCEIIRK